MNAMKEKIAKTILSMTAKAVNRSSDKDYMKIIGYVEGLEKSGEIKPRFAAMLKKDIKDQFYSRQESMRERFRRMWRLTE